MMRKRKIDPTLELQKNVNNKTIKDDLKRERETSQSFINERNWTIVTITYVGVLFCIAWTAFTYLPIPKTQDSAKPNDFIEEIARSHLSKFVGFGHRPAGSTANEVDSVEFILQTVKEIQKLSSSSIQFEVDVQHPTGSFSIDFLSGFASYYTNITNTVVKISPASGGSNIALLLNCHTDSVGGAPGASDDAVACAVLLEVMRALVVDNNQPLLHTVMFLFNGAEENVLQASHGFITQHPWAKEVKAFINLEAAGAGGKELVFQTGPSNPWLAMTWAAHAPHPFGTVVGQELFQSGVIPADTDFRIFRDFGKIPGIDLAYMRNGYVYHSVYDNMDMIQPGAIQRAGDNILAVVKHLVKSKSSLLPNPSIYKHGTIAFLDILGLFMLVFPVRLLVICNWACSVGGFLYVVRRLLFASGSGFVVFGKQVVKAIVTVVLTWMACFVTCLVLSGSMTNIGRMLSFHSHPSLVVFIYAIPGFLSMLAVHQLFRELFFKNENPWRIEEVFFCAYLLIWSILLFQANYYHFQSSLILLLCVAPTLLIRCVLCRSLFNSFGETTSLKKFLVYLASIFPHCLIIMKHAILVMEFFIPLCNRLGSDAPPDIVISILAAAFVCLFCHFTLSTVHVVSSLKRFMLGLVLTTGFAYFLASTSYGFPYAYSSTNPTTKRLYIQHTSREFYEGSDKLLRSDSGLWVNTMDYPGFSTDMGSKELKDSTSFPCTGIFCHSPWILPIYHLIRNSKYIPAANPFKNLSVSDPLLVKTIENEMTLLIENSTTSVYRKRISFMVSGPSHMSLQIGTLSSEHFAAELTDWSLDCSPDIVKVLPLADPIDKNQAYNGWYFIFYGSGIKPYPWRPWFEFLVYQSKSKGSVKELPTVEFGFSSHHYSDERTIPVPEQTAGIRSLTKDLHDWVMHISWLSGYKNYLF